MRRALLLPLLFACTPPGPSPDEVREYCTTQVEPFLDLTRQAQLDALEGCTDIFTNLTIGGDDLDLTPLSSLEHVHGWLFLGVNSSELNSLDGLQRLRVIDGPLSLTQLGVTDLSALSGLEAINADPPAFLDEEPGQNIDRLEVFGCPNLTNLDELDDVTGIGSLEINGAPALTRIGWTLPAESPRVFVQGAGLTDLSFLAETQQVGELTVSNLPLDDLSGLESLRVVQSLEVRRMPGLRDLSALEGLTSVDDLSLTGLGASTVRLPSVTRLRGLRVLDNDGLRLDLGALVEVDESVNLRENVGLLDAGLPALVRVGGLSLSRNVGLTAIGLPALETVEGGVFLTENPELPHEDAVAFADGLTVGGLVKIYGNLGSPPPLFPCPFVEDGYCDEPLLCAPGTDDVDCEVQLD